jgi:hypothetical protein
LGNPADRRTGDIVLGTSASISGPTITGIASFTGATAAVANNATVGGTLGVTGLATLSGGATVSGTFTATGPVTNGDLVNSSEEVIRREDAADELFRELARRATGKA